MDLLSWVGLLARAGGGGSDSGGGGSGGGIFGIALVGYVPCHMVSVFVVRRAKTTAAIIAGALMAVVVTWIFVAFTWSDDPFLTILVAIGAVLGIAGGTADLTARLRKDSAKTAAALQVSASKDPAWHQETLLKHVSQTFYDYQKDWSSFNLEHIQTYTTPAYFHHNSLMLAALHTMGRRNQVNNPQLVKCFIAQAIDSDDNNYDSFVAVIVGKANDQLLDVTENKVLYTDNRPFTEFWRFVRHGDKWLLAGIDQATADALQAHEPLRQFAHQNNMFYSLDWGWLLLPKRGKLFGRARFGMADINNHVIGQWNGIIVQLYTYMYDKRTDGNNYQVAQITLPKSYGGIIIRPRSVLNIAPRGYQRMVYEWPDFNKRWTVYTTDADKLASFELLNPKFMANLYDKKLKISIEVVDNVVYIYSPVAHGITGYSAMLDILQQAFRELKL